MSWKLGLGWNVSYLRAGMFDSLAHGVSPAPRTVPGIEKKLKKCSLSL